MHSIVLALGVARLLGGIADVARLWHRMQTKWLLIAWLVVLLTQHIGWWFGLWVSFQSATQVPLSIFALSLSIPASLYVASRLLVPDLAGSDSADFADRFETVRIPFFVSLVISVGPYPAIRYFLYDAGPLMLLLFLFGAIALIGIFIRSIRWHYVLVGVIAMVYWSFLFLARGSIGGA